LSSVRDMIGAQRRWYAAVARHGEAIDAGNPDDWQLVGELSALPSTFEPELRAVIARSIIGQDVLGARASLTAYAKRHREAAVASRRLLDQHAPTLSSLYGAELTPTRRVSRAVAPAEPTQQTRWGLWATLGLLVIGVTAALVVARPGVAVAEEHVAVTQICQMVGIDHPGCLIASSVATGLEHGDCAMVSKGLPILEEKLAGFGLNRELAVIRADHLGELRGPFSELDASYMIHCM
ncbi:MAG: hypothetical protein QF464_05165, partial [Myxococcota bacterium]|nr:hypothetical protein [Myxococcota bacterium]